MMVQRPRFIVAVVMPALCGFLLTGLNTSANAKTHKHHVSVDTPAPARHHHHSADNETASSDSNTTKHRRHHSDQQASTESATPKHHRHHSEDVALSEITPTESRHQARLDRLAHLKRLHAQEAEAERLARMTPHQKRLAKLHEQAYQQHLVRLAAKQEYAGHLHRLALLQQHYERLARINDAHDAKLHAQHLAQLAHAEAVRDEHADKKSRILASASSTGLPIWQGDAYAAQVPVKIVQVDLNDPRIRVSALLARDGIGTSEPFSRMIDRAHPNVAVTGTFFSLDNLRPVGDIVVNGSLAYFGGMGTALAITPGNRADMITVPWGHHHDWTGYETVVACGPRLLSNGAIVLDPAMEHFKDQHMLGPNSRIAVGITRTNQLVFCMTREPIYLGRLAKIMLSLGCRQAMNLDAGTSTGFYCNGRVMARPGRWLTNAIVVYSNRKPRPQEEARTPRRTASLLHLASAQY